MALTTACHDDGRTRGSNQGDASTSSDTSEGVDSRSDAMADGSSGESAGPEESEGSSCAHVDVIPDLPYAIARRIRLDDGSTAVGIQLQSWPATCDTLTSAVPASQTRVELRLPVDLETPARLDLVEARAIAYIAAGGPGSTDPIFELRFLHGPIAVDAFDSEHVVGSLQTEVVPFVGCFEAPVCDDES